MLSKVSSNTTLSRIVISGSTHVRSLNHCVVVCRFTGADNKTLLWDVGTGDVLAELDLNDLLYSITFSYSGDKIATTCKDKFLRVHNARTLEVLKVSLIFYFKS